MSKKIWLIPGSVIAAMAIAFTVAGVQRTMASDWRTASRASVGIAPDPAKTPEAVVQVYDARAWGWRGAFGVHTWIAVKPSHAPAFTVYEVIGWRIRHGMSAVSVSQRPPDGRWFGSKPKILADLRGQGVDAVIEKIKKAAASYPYPHDYVVWPGPNSNTFTAYVIRQVPELKVDLPPTAIGKDYLPNGEVVAKPPGGSGLQVSLFGLLGVIVGREEGFELNILGLTFGIDPRHGALKLPGIGLISFEHTG